MKKLNRNFYLIKDRNNRKWVNYLDVNNYVMYDSVVNGINVFDDNDDGDNLTLAQIENYVNDGWKIEF